MRRWFSSSPESNSTSRIARGLPRNIASSVAWNSGISAANPSMVSSTNSTAMGLSVTRCWAASIAAWNEPKWQTPSARLPRTGDSCSLMAVE